MAFLVYIDQWNTVNAYRLIGTYVQNQLLVKVRVHTHTVLEDIIVIIHSGSDSEIGSQAVFLLVIVKDIVSVTSRDHCMRRKLLVEKL